MIEKRSAFSIGNMLRGREECASSDAGFVCMSKRTMHVLFGENSLWGIVLSVIHWQIASARNIENISIFFIKICQLLVKLYIATCYPL